MTFLNDILKGFNDLDDSFFKLSFDESDGIHKIFFGTIFGEKKELIIDLKNKVLKHEKKVFHFSDIKEISIDGFTPRNIFVVKKDGSKHEIFKLFGDGKWLRRQSNCSRVKKKILDYIGKTTGLPVKKYKLFGEKGYKVNQ